MTVQTLFPSDTLAHTAKIVLKSSQGKCLITADLTGVTGKVLAMTTTDGTSVTPGDYYQIVTDGQAQELADAVDNALYLTSPGTYLVSKQVTSAARAVGYQMDIDVNGSVEILS